MSETVHYKGIATKVYQENGKTVLETAEDLLKQRNIVMADYYANAIECLCSIFSYEFFFYPGTQSLYALTCEGFKEEDEIAKAKEIGQDTFEYELRFYNGGTSFDECLTEAFDKL